LSFEEVILFFSILLINNFIRGGAIIAYMQNKIINISIGKRFIYLISLKYPKRNFYKILLYIKNKGSTHVK
tara:strand:+ start:225 stop:437 length:213 start_codon:yes stop_codon:yes gene_type:complete